ncbi:DUF4180 domain-containing protein [Mucilaginibacter sp. HC2]|uniref:DUF4180 domain-containing protein n=1 Tax=Mucilaginibacter inviolabilis TaxID=2714892 RepID=UPI00140B65B2|nr:DUF4180 domain-containing protein [Mucilaginibacter inviolabilis]NHA06798.1 DUF4180 domain-containing protein [Mucilaginibacter inviolabilis]
MDINLINTNNLIIAEIVSDSIIINDAQDALDILANCAYQDANRIIVYQKDITEDFFELKTKLAGEVLQKFSNYNSKLAIVGDFSGYGSKSLRDFIYESNKAGRVSFVATKEDAIEALLKGVKV